MKASYSSLSPYAFVGDSPTNASDPDGMRMSLFNGIENTEGMNQLLSTVEGRRLLTYFADDGQMLTVLGEDFCFSDGGGLYSDVDLNIELMLPTDMIQAAGLSDSVNDGERQK